MERLDELVLELENLPDGYISRKTIKGKVYSYLQYFHKGKIISKYVPADKLADLEAKLAQRKAIEQELKGLSTGNIEMPPLTKREKELTGNVMFGDKVAAKLYKGEVVSVNKPIAPAFLRKSKDGKAFFASRAIDTSRANARDLLKALGIKESNEAIIPLYVNGCCLTDNYWFRPSGAVTKYEELEFGNNLYAGAAYDGGKREYQVKPSRTPELTTSGHFEKCWRFEKDAWWLYKKESEDEIFSELFVTELAHELEIRTIKYIRTDDGVKSRNFASKYNFEPMSGYIDNADDIEGGFKALKPYGTEVLKDYIRLRYLDAITYNLDRSLNDMGVMRNRTTGAVVGLAPNFDNNSCLTAVSPRLDIDPENDPIMTSFIKFLKSKREVRKLFKKCKFYKISKDIIKKIAIKANPDMKNQKGAAEALADFINDRIEYIRKFKKVSVE